MLLLVDLGLECLLQLGYLQLNHLQSVLLLLKSLNADYLWLLLQSSEFELKSNSAVFEDSHFFEVVGDELDDFDGGIEYVGEICLGIDIGLIDGD